MKKEKGLDRMSKIEINDYFIKTKKIKSFSFECEDLEAYEISTLIPIKNITDIDSEDYYNGLNQVIDIEYYNRGQGRNCIIYYKTKKERDEDFKKLAKLERSR